MKYNTKKLIEYERENLHENKTLYRMTFKDLKEDTKRNNCSWKDSLEILAQFKQAYINSNKELQKLGERLSWSEKLNYFETERLN